MKVETKVQLLQWVMEGVTSVYDAIYGEEIGLEYMKDESPRVRKKAEELLMTVSSKHVPEETLIRYAKSRNAGDRALAAIHPSTPRKWQDKLLKDPDRQVRAWVEETLKKIRDKQ